MNIPFLSRLSGRPKARLSYHVLGAAAFAACVGAGDAHAYGFWKAGAGRADFQSAGRYDLNGIPWVAQSGTPLVYDFGNVALGTGFLSGIGLDATVVNAAVENAANAWEAWANISFGDASGVFDSSKVRLVFDSSTTEFGAATASVDATATERSFADIVFYGQVQPGVAWTAENFQWTVMHELGHVMGLDDTYLRPSEEFVDHPISGFDRPDIREIGCQDNVMDRANTARHGNCYDTSVNDYSKPMVTIIDNDEIAAMAWLWGSPFNQIVTGRLDDRWLDGSWSRETLPHHGDEPGNDGWWTYRGTFGHAGNEPCIDISFPGFQEFVMRTFPVAPVRFDGDLFGNGVQRICIEAANWAGNFELMMRSSITTEGLVTALMKDNFGDTRIDMFVQQPDPSGRNFASSDDRHATWAALFGPQIPEPGTVVLLLGAVISGWGTRAWANRRGSVART